MENSLLAILTKYNFKIHCQDAEHYAKNLWETYYTRSSKPYNQNQLKIFT